MTLFTILTSLLYVKSVLTGVIPFRFHRSSLTLELNSALLCFCFLVAIAGPTIQFGIYVSMLIKAFKRINVTFSYAVFMSFGDVFIFIVPPCYLLTQQTNVKQLYEIMKKLYQSPVLVDEFPVKVWFRKCLLFNLSYECAYSVNILCNVFLPGGASDPAYLQMLPWMVLSLLTKSTVLLLLYGAVQYVMMVAVKLQKLLTTPNISMGPVQQENIRQLHLGKYGYMEFYELLWKASQSINALFGVPLLAYLSGAFIHAISIYYVVCYKMLVGWSRYSSHLLFLGGLEFIWTNFDLMYLIIIVGACGKIREESRKTQKLLLRLNLNPMDHKLKQSIEVFVLQTLHQPLEFTACRMFTLDYTVLFSIAASVTNYLIILIQFEMAIDH
uniref:Gustatory receptor n=1 Tax=Anopheles minimus TaxID=112268 RepID=A0A182VUF9_9DIPT